MQKWLCMKRANGIVEQARITTNRNEIVLLEGDRIVYIPIYPGYYGRTSVNGGRIICGNGTYGRLCKVSVPMRKYETTLTVGTTTWIAPYDGIYEVVINGAGGGASGVKTGYHDGGENGHAYHYFVGGGKDGGNGKQNVIQREYEQGQRIPVEIGKAGTNGRDDVRIRKSHPFGKYQIIGESGTSGGKSVFDDVDAMGGGGATYEKSGYEWANRIGGRGGHVEIHYGGHYFGSPDGLDDTYTKTPPEDGSILIRLLAGG